MSSTVLWIKGALLCPGVYNLASQQNFSPPPPFNSSFFCRYFHCPPSNSSLYNGQYIYPWLWQCKKGVKQCIKRFKIEKKNHSRAGHPFHCLYSAINDQKYYKNKFQSCLKNLFRKSKFLKFSHLPLDPIPGGLRDWGKVMLGGEEEKKFAPPYINKWHKIVLKGALKMRLRRYKN